MYRYLFGVGAYALVQLAALVKAKYRDGCRGGTIYLTSNLKFQPFEEPEPDIPFDGNS